MGWGVGCGVDAALGARWPLASGPAGEGGSHWTQLPLISRWFY